MRRGLAVDTMNYRLRGSMMLMAGMGLGNRRRERKHDQDDRRFQNSHRLPFNHQNSFLQSAAQPIYPGSPEQPRWNCGQFIFLPCL